MIFTYEEELGTYNTLIRDSDGLYLGTVPTHLFSLLRNRKVILKKVEPKVSVFTIKKEKNKFFLNSGDLELVVTNDELGFFNSVYDELKTNKYVVRRGYEQKESGESIHKGFDGYAIFTKEGQETQLT